jgi:hypothetical protein
MIDQGKQRMQWRAFFNALKMAFFISFHFGNAIFGCILKK